MEGGGGSARPYLSLYVLNRYREPCDRGNELFEIKQKTTLIDGMSPSFLSTYTNTPHTG